MTRLLLPALYGKFQEWTYYQIIFSLHELVGQIELPTGEMVYRIKTTDEVNEIYSQKGLNNLLQRVFNKKRLKPIIDFLTNQPDAYVNNLTLAIYGGDPRWIGLDLRNSSKDITEKEFDKITNSFGIIELNGNETIFVLDGQHRLKALREAYYKKNDQSKKEIAVTLIIHKPTAQGREKTRRLFTIINRYAKPVSLGESILLDEDDLSAILVRNLIEKYPLFKDRDIVALNKTANLDIKKDKDKFTTVIALYRVNEILIDYKKLDFVKFSHSKELKIRPHEKMIIAKENYIFEYWDRFFELFKSAKLFVNKRSTRSENAPGPVSLRPIGQIVFLKLMKTIRDQNLNLERLKDIPDDLGNEFWENILYDPVRRRVLTNESFAYNYLRFQLGLPMSENENAKLKSKYEKMTGANLKKYSLPLR